MKKLKKLALLCTAILASGTMAVASGCDLFTPASSASDSVGTESSIDSGSSESGSEESSVPEVVTYSVKFVNEDGTVLQESEVEEGQLPVYSGETPTKEGDAQYSYVFSWDKELSEVTGDVTYTATFTPVVKKYTVVWKNADGTVLETDTEVAYGTMPQYDAEAPTKEGDAQYTYTFNGWDVEVVAVAGDVIYTATFEGTVNKYTITLNKDNGEDNLVLSNIEYGTTAEALYADNMIPSKAGYDFDGWYVDTVKVQTTDTVQGDMTLKAAWNVISYKATVSKAYDVDATQEISFTVNDKTEKLVEIQGLLPADDAEWNYEWAQAPTELALENGQEFTITRVKQQYTVTFKDAEGETISSEALEYGASLETPDVSAYERADKLMSWNKEIASTVTENVEYALVYKELTSVGAIWDFNDPTIVRNDLTATSGGSYYSEYLASHDGEEGVVAVTNTYGAEWNFNVTFLTGYTDLMKTDADLAKISGANALFIRVKASVANVITIYTTDDIGGTLICYEYNVPTEWTTLVITGENFKHFQDYQAHYRGTMKMPMKFAGTIYFSEFYVGKVENNAVSVEKGSEVELPEMNYTKMMLDKATAPNGSALDLTSGKFVADQTGAYTISYTALDENGALVVGTYTINSYGSVEELGAIWNFNDPNVVSQDYNANSGASFYSEHLTSFDGEEGVVAIHNVLDADWNWNVRMLNGYTDLIKTDADFAKISNANALFIRIKGSVANVVTIYGTDDIGASLICYEVQIPTEWTTLVITGENFKHFQDYQAHYRGVVRMPMKNKGVIYISEIYTGIIGELVPTSEVVKAGEVTISDNAATKGYENVKYSVVKADGTPVAVTNGKFVAEDGCVYTVSYTAIYNGLGIIGSYNLLSVTANNGNWTPDVSDWGKQGADAYDNISVLPGVGYRVECNNSACHTRVPSLKAYMQANGLTTVTIKIYCVTNVALGSTLHGHTDTVNYSAGQVVVFENVSIFDADYYIQSIWSAMTYYVVIDLGLTA